MIAVAMVLLERSHHVQGQVESGSQKPHLRPQKRGLVLLPPDRAAYAQGQHPLCDDAGPERQRWRRSPDYPWRTGAWDPEGQTQERIRSMEDPLYTGISGCLYYFGIFLNKR